MKKLYNILIAASFGLLAVACTDEPEEPAPVLSPVTGLAAQAGDEQVNLSWTAPGDAQPIDYQVTFMEGTSKKILYTGSQTACEIVNLSNGTEYVFSVKSVYEDELLSEAATVAATPKSERQSVSGFSAAADDETAHLSWTVSEKAFGYTLSWTAEGEKEGRVTLEATASSYDVAGLVNGKEYTFSICALFNRGASEPTVAKATPMLARFPVKDLAAKAGEENVVLSWTSPSVGVLAYELTISVDGEEPVTKELAKDAVSYKADNLTNGKEYTFSLKANYRQGWSETVVVKSTPVFTRIPVTGLQAVAGDKKVTLKWTAPAAVKDYPVQSYIVLNGEQTAATPAGDAVSAIISDLQNNTEYTFSVIAVYTTGNSEAATVKATPVDVIPWTVSATEIVAGHEVTFTYDNSLLPATGIKWTVNGAVKEGAVITCPVEANNYNVDVNDAQNVEVILDATVGGSERSWTITLKVKPYVFIKKDWDIVSGSYNGFKADVPVFSPDGKTMYLLTFNKPAKLYAVDAATGEEKWRFTPVNSASYNGVTVNPVTGVIYFGVSTANHFYAVKPEGTLLWENTTDIGAMNQTSFPAVSKDGKTVFVHDAAKKVTALNAETGAKIWQVDAPAKGAGLLVNGEELVVASCATTGGVKFLKTSDGSEIASFDLPQNGSDCGGIAVSPDRKTAYVCTNKGDVCAFSLETHQLIRSVVPPSITNNIWELAVSPSGDVFGGSKAGCAFCYSGDLQTLKWQDDYAVTNAYNYAHPCCDVNGNFLISAGGTYNHTFVFAPDGTKLHDWQYGVNANTNKVMSGNAYHNGILYSLMIGIAGDNGAVYAKYVGGQEATTGWPCHGGDLCGSCCIK